MIEQTPRRICQLDVQATVACDALCRFPTCNPAFGKNSADLTSIDDHVWPNDVLVGARQPSTALSSAGTRRPASTRPICISRSW